jgi:hypothetical protein
MNPTKHPQSSRTRREASTADYSVGYARPPKHTQYKPGQTGNPRGRPKKRASLQDIVTEVLFEKIEVRIGERTQKIASVSALMRITMNRAIKGDHKFVTAALALIRLSGLSDNNIDALVSDVDISADKAILADFFRRYRNAPEIFGVTEPENKHSST